MSRRKKLALFTVALLAAAILAAPAAPAAGPIQLRVNGELLVFDANPIIENGRTLVPARGICEKLGGIVSFDPATQTVTIVKDTTTIKLQLGDNKAFVNGLLYRLDAPAKAVNGRTYIPVRFVSEALKTDVGWDADGGISIVSKKSLLQVLEENHPQLAYALYNQPTKYNAEVVSEFIMEAGTMAISTRTELQFSTNGADFAMLGTVTGDTSGLPAGMGDEPTVIEMIMTGNSLYTKLPDGTWEVTAAPDDYYGQISDNPTAQMESTRAMFTNLYDYSLTQEGTATVNGQETQVYIITFDFAEALTQSFQFMDELYGTDNAGGMGDMMKAFSDMFSDGQYTIRYYINDASQAVKVESDYSSSFAVQGETMKMSVTAESVFTNIGEDIVISVPDINN